jgi:hypothetical protein
MSGDISPTGVSTNRPNVPKSDVSVVIRVPSSFGSATSQRPESHIVQYILMADFI